MVRAINVNFGKYNLNDKRPLIDYEGLGPYGMSGGAVMTSSGKFIAHYGKWVSYPPKTFIGSFYPNLMFVLKGFGGLTGLPTPFIAPKTSKENYYIPFSFYEIWIKTEINKLSTLPDLKPD